MLAYCLLSISHLFSFFDAGKPKCFYRSDLKLNGASAISPSERRAKNDGQTWAEGLTSLRSALVQSVVSEDIKTALLLSYRRTDDIVTFLLGIKKERENKEKG